MLKHSHSNQGFRRELVKVLERAAKSGELDDFLDYILSPAEFQEISLRLQAGESLLKGETQRRIAERLGMGIMTVSRCARALNEHRKTIEKLL